MGSAVGVNRHRMVEVATAPQLCRARSALIVGNLLATVSCCWLLPFAVPNTTHWEQLRVNVLSHGVMVSAVCALLAIGILPFARSRVKWFSFSGSALNACMIALFFLSLD